MSREEKFPCPSCGATVSKGDMYCRRCGANLTELSKTVPEGPPSPPERLPEEFYERKLSLAKRFCKLLTAPSEAMKDIALAPDYGGVVVVFALYFVALSVTSGILLQKIQFSGPQTAKISNMVSGLLAAATLIAAILFVAKWAIKSLIVKYGCDSGSGWDFKTSASITGYAYVVDLIIGTVGLCVGWLLLPTLHIESTDLGAMRQAFNDYEAQLNWLSLLYCLPFSLFGLLWKSYLGGLGAHFGTKEKCSLSTGIAVFFVLSLMGFLISFVT